MLVSANTFRHPALLAQAAVTVDHVSGGRLELGIGTGWFAEEHRQLGLPLGTPGERLARLAEALPIVDALLRGETATFAGRFYTVDGAFVQPRPLQQPRPPITLGAHRPGMLRLAARHADRWNSYGTVEEIRERMRVLDEHCAELGRDPAEIRRSVYCWSAQAERQGLPDPWSSAAAFEEVVERYRAVGVDELVFDQPRAEQLPVLERVASDVIPQLR
jgi:alkanesulfonate monooxygenase SsuD/methylene tetrahydromethanopterin reductase-like flavin-dependent oxidoreductase (luciferase family)